MKNGRVLYSDGLVEITEGCICFKNYYFPVGSKYISFSDILSVTTAHPNWLNGKYRLHGSGDLRTWFPRDWHRPSRSEIFYAHVRNSSRCIGFTVEDAVRVEQILRDKHLLVPPSGKH